MLTNKMQLFETDITSSLDLDSRITHVRSLIKFSPLSGDLWAQLGFNLQLKDMRFHDSGMSQNEALFAYKMALKLLDPVSNLVNRSVILQ